MSGVRIYSDVVYENFTLSKSNRQSWEGVSGSKASIGHAFQ